MAGVSSKVLDALGELVAQELFKRRWEQKGDLSSSPLQYRWYRVAGFLLHCSNQPPSMVRKSRNQVLWEMMGTCW